MTDNIHIALSGETLFHIGAFAITNSLLTTWIVMTVLIVSSATIFSQYKKIPTKSQLIFEMIVMGLYGAFKPILGEKTDKFFPLLATFFIFIVCANWFGLLPGVGTIGIKESHAIDTISHEYKTADLHTSDTSHPTDSHTTQTDHDTTQPSGYVDAGHEGEEEHHGPFDIPLLRAPTADLNTTLALALIGMGMLQYWGIQSLGTFGYLGKFITFKDPINFFVGILELISEIGKVISFAFRLFGNIFAGEVLLVIIGSLIPVIAPLPFLGLEIFVGFIQGLVFAMLLAVFLSIATTKAHH